MYSKSKGIQFAEKAKNFLGDEKEISISYSSKSINVDLWWDKDENEMIMSYYGAIILLNLDEDAEVISEEEIGEFIIEKIPFFDFYGEELDYLTIADEYHIDLEIISKEVERLTKDPNMFEDLVLGILYISRLYIKPEYRGNKLGHYVLPVILDGCDAKGYIATVIPNPLGDMTKGLTEDKKEDFTKTKEFKTAKNKIEKFLTQFEFIEQRNSVWTLYL